MGGGSVANMADPDPRYPRSSIEDDFNYGSCVASASVHIRMAFLRKVYSILSLQVLLTTVTSAIFLYCESIRVFVHASPALILVFALGSLGFIFALTLNRHKHPLNLYLLFGFTLLEALTVGIAVTFYDVYVVLQAFILTTAVFLGLTAYTLQSKRDFSKFGAGLQEISVGINIVDQPTLLLVLCCLVLLEWSLIWERLFPLFLKRFYLCNCVVCIVKSLLCFPVSNCSPPIHSSMSFKILFW
uniref:Transmembrane BAX inhibitor motif containing 4 n=1 Tax=Oryctolagus cuniculus TaxID=9986 RepID=A0A5F9DPK4_RABIT